MSDDVRRRDQSVLTDVLDKGPDLGASWDACAEAGLLGLAAPTETVARAAARRGRRARARGRRPGPGPAGPRDPCLRSATARPAGTPEAGDVRPADRRRRPAVARPSTRSASRSRPARDPPRHDRVTGRKLGVPTSTTSRTRRPCCSSPPPTRAASRSSYPRPAERRRHPYRRPRARAARRRGDLRFDGAPVLGVLATEPREVLRQHAIAGLLLQGDGLWPERAT